MDDIFTTIPNVAISDLLLDINNFRLGSLDSQQNCIHAMLNDKQMYDKLYNLAKNISINGLYNRRIVVTKHPETDAYVVRDGNRRITALKLLANPNEAPENFRNYFAALSRDAQGFIPSRLDCICAVSEEIALNDMELSHTGEQNGVGQVTWGPFEKGNLDIERGTNPRYAVARSTLAYMESIGIPDANKISITTLDRFLSPRVREKIGMGWDGNKISFEVSEAFTANILSEFFKDMITGTHNVRDIISVDLALSYVDTTLLKISGLPPPQASPLAGTSEVEGGLATPQLASPATSSVSPATTQGGVSAPRKSRTDRKHIFDSKTKHNVPVTEVKIINIVYELKRLNTHDTPIAAGVLVRLVVEFSVEYFLKKHAIPYLQNDNLSNKVRVVCEKLYTDKHIAQKEKNAFCSGAKPLIDTVTMNAWVHDSNQKPDYKIINTFFDNILPFLNLCWTK